jgi:MFS family permease
MGVGMVIPLLASAVKSPTLRPSSAIAAVLSIGFLGLLLGPPLIGLLSSVFGLRYALLLCAALAIAMFYLALQISVPT